jgi:ketosteroid isomerase-like protein
MSAEDGIRRAILQYTHAHDTYDTEGLVQVWADDGLFVTPNAEFRGHASIRDFHNGRKARAVPDVQNRLMAADPMITVNGGTAEALTSVIGLRRGGEEPWSVVFFAQWADKFVEAGDRWLFTERRVLYP